MFIIFLLDHNLNLFWGFHTTIKGTKAKSVDCLNSIFFPICIYYFFLTGNGKKIVRCKIGCRDKEKYCLLPIIIKFLQ